MGPFFALGHALGLGPWLVQRLWLGLLLALAAWGAVRLMDELAGPRTRAHAVAGLLVLLNPYVVVFTGRTTVTLLGYAALPWLLVCVARGLTGTWIVAGGVRADRDRLGWGRERGGDGVVARRTAAAGALRALDGVGDMAGAVALRLADGAGDGARLGVVGRAAARPVALRRRLPALHGAARHDLEHDQPVGVAAAAGLLDLVPGRRLRRRAAPVLRQRRRDAVRACPSSWPGCSCPALALTGFAWTRTHAYGPFALLLVIAGLLIMSAGFPEGTPLRRAANFTYNHVALVQFLRTTYKAGPLVVIGIAVLGGLAAARVPRRAWLVGALLLPLLASWPLLRGRGVDDQLLWDRIPSAWQQAADHVDAREGRAVVLPGQLYAYYDWGGTIDPILPVLADKPVATRNAVGYADLHATDLLWTVDALVQQRRAVPGQLEPLLDLLGARTVLAGADDDRTRSGAAPAADAADVLDAARLARRRLGRAPRAARAAGTLGPARALPQVRAWDRPGAPGLVRVEPEQPRVVLDGSAEGVAALAAFGGLARGGLAYAGDLTPAAIAAAPEVVVTDSNRRRVFVVSRLVQNTGPVLAADEAPSADAAVLDPFAARGSDAQTVAAYDGVAALRAPSSPGFPQFPERRPYAALDGDTATAWLADRALTPDRHTLEVTFDAPRDVDEVRLLPYNDRRATVTAVEVNGRRHAVQPGWNDLPVGPERLRKLTIRIAAVRKPDGPTAGAGGIRELEIPGVTVREALRVPVLAERALAGRDVSRTGLTYLFQRTTGDDPFRRAPERGSAGAALVRDRGDGERGLVRAIEPPAARTWQLDGWAGPPPKDVTDRAARPVRRDRRTRSIRRPRASRAVPASVPRARSTARPSRGSDTGPATAARVARVGAPGGDDRHHVDARSGPRRAPADERSGEHRERRHAAARRRRRRASCGCPRRCARSASGSRSWAPRSRPAPQA